MNGHMFGPGDGRTKEIRDKRLAEIDARRAREARAAARAARRNTTDKTR